jgi:hypothetical protein
MLYPWLLLLRAVRNVANNRPIFQEQYQERAKMSMETDVNYLLHRQQMSLILAQASPSREGRSAYESLAQRYIEQIDAYKQENAKLIVRAH